MIGDQQLLCSFGIAYLIHTWYDTVAVLHTVELVLHNTADFVLYRVVYLYNIITVVHFVVVRWKIRRNQSFASWVSSFGRGCFVYTG